MFNSSMNNCVSISFLILVFNFCSYSNSKEISINKPPEEIIKIADYIAGKKLNKRGITSDILLCKGLLVNFTRFQDKGALDYLLLKLPDWNKFIRIVPLNEETGLFSEHDYQDGFMDINCKSDDLHTLFCDSTFKKLSVYGKLEVVDASMIPGVNVELPYKIIPIISRYTVGLNKYGFLWKTVFFEIRPCKVWSFRYEDKSCFKSHCKILHVFIPETGFPIVCKLNQESFDCKKR